MLDYPVELSPFAKPHRSEPGLVERFEGFIGGIEIANAFSELNDPDEQRARFEQQQRLLAAGDEEAQPFDEDYRARARARDAADRRARDRHRPAADDALGRPSIREVVLFPRCASADRLTAPSARATPTGGHAEEGAYRDLGKCARNPPFDR